MSKEITAIVVDLSSSMGRPHGTTTRIDHALDFVFDSLIAKVLKGRKTDFVSVVACHSPTTNNPFADDDSFQGISVLLNKVCPTYAHLRDLKLELVPNERLLDSQGDCFEAMLVAIGLMKEDQRLKFIRNVIVITDNESRVDSFNSALGEASRGAINDMNINVMVCSIDYGLHADKTRQCHERGWKEAISHYKNGSIIGSDELLEIINFRPPLKRVKPMRMFRGNLTFGIDPESLISDDYVADSSVLSLQVEVFPAVKPELLPQIHQYHLDKDVHKIEKVSANTEYFVYDGEEKEEEDTEKKEKKKITIEKGDWTDGFKYSNFDLVSVDKNLAEAARLKGEPSMTIMGFIKIDSLPVAFFTKESQYLVPGTMAATRSLVGYNCFCQSLLDLDSVALVRYVQKLDDEVHICALIPSKVKIGCKYSFCMQMVRLPFKEDEKMGRFPNLTLGTSDDSKNTTSPDSLMESLILAKDFDLNATVKEEKIAGEAYFIENPKVELAGNQSVLSKANVNENVESKLAALSPAIHKFSRNLNKIIKISLDREDLYDFLNDPEFVSKYLAKENQTNLFNINNILCLNYSNDATWLSDVNKGAKELSKKLAKNTRYIKMEEYKKLKKRKLDNTMFNLPSKTQGSYGANEGDFDEELDLESLLQED